MPRAITCQKCGKDYVIRDKHVGTKARCRCGCIQTIPSNSPVVSAPGTLLDSGGMLFCSVGLLLLSLLAGGGVGAWVALDHPGGQQTASQTAAAEPKTESPKAKPAEKEADGPKPDKKEKDPPATPEKKEDPPKPEKKEETGPARMTEQQLHEKLLKSVVWIYGSNDHEAWTGSGAVIHVGKRLIITNQHVVGNERRVQVVFPVRGKEGDLITDKKYYRDLLRTGKSQPARVLVADRDRDLAVIQLETPLPLDTFAVKVAPRHAKPGEKLVSVGNPGASSGLWVLSSGVVRTRVPQIRFNAPVRNKEGKVVGTKEVVWRPAWSLETTLPINSGDSGSVVVNDRGQVVAVNFGAILGGANLMMCAVDRDEVLEVLRKVGVREEEVVVPDTLPPTSAVVLGLIKQIEDAGQAVSRKGVEALSRLDPAEARRAIPALCRALQRYDDEAFRRRITEELERIGPPVKADLECLGPLMRLAYPRARMYVIEALRQLGTDARQAVPVLAQALKDRESEIRKKAATVLRDLGPSARPRAFRALLDTSNDDDEEVARAAFDALCELGRLTAAEIDLLVEALGDAKRRPLVRRFAAYRLGEQGQTAAKAVPALTRVLRDDKDVLVPKLAADALGRIGEKTKEALAALLQAVLGHSSEAVRLAALDALALLDLSVFSTTQMLERTSRENEPSEKVRIKVAQLLGRRLGLLTDKNMAEVRPVLQHKDPGMVLVGLDLIIRKKQGAVLVPDLAGLVKHSDDKVGEQAAKALETLGADARSAVPSLLAALKDLVKHRQLQVAVAVASIDPKNDKVQQGALPVLVEGLHPTRVAVGGRSLQPAINKVLKAVGQPAVDAIFKRFETMSYRGRENGIHRKHLFMALEILGPDCKSKENYATLKMIRARDLRDYADTFSAAGKALAAMDPD